MADANTTYTARIHVTDKDGTRIEVVRVTAKRVLGYFLDFTPDAESKATVFASKAEALDACDVRIAYYARLSKRCRSQNDCRVELVASGSPEPTEADLARWDNWM